MGLMDTVRENLTPEEKTVARVEGWILGIA